MKTTNYIKFLSTIFIIIQTSINVYAQNTSDEKYYINNNRHWFAEIPIWIPGFRGQISYGEIELSSSGNDEEGGSERLENDTGIEFYFVGRIAAKYNKIWIQADAFSGAVSSSFSYTSLISNTEKEIVEVKVNGTIPRLILGYSIWSKSDNAKFNIELVPYAGIRYVSLKLRSEVFDLTNLIDVKPDWFEPLVGVYIPVIYKRFKIEIQADYGYSGNNNSWVVSNRYRYRISQLIDVQLGWNLIRLYHKGIIDDKELETTIRLFGPTAGVGFRF